MIDPAPPTRPTAVLTRHDALLVGGALVGGLAIGSTVFVSPILPVLGAAALGIVFVMIDLAGFRAT